MSDHTEAVDTRFEPANGSRRMLLGKGAVAALTGAVAAVALSDPGSAANGDELTVGDITSGTASTRLTGGSTLRVDNGTSNDDSSIVGVVGGSTASGRWGVKGENAGGTPAATGAGVYGTARTDGASGVYAENTSPNGVGLIAQHTIEADGSGTGLIASSTNGTGIKTSGPETDIELDGSGILYFSGEGVGGTGAGRAGELASNGAGELWYCYETGIGKWVRLAAPSSAGSYNPVTPFRAYDSRRALPAQGRLGIGAQRVISVADSRDASTGSVIASDAVPARATAVTYNLTVVNTAGRGFLSVAEGDAASTQASTINWASDGQVIANAGTVKLDASRQIKVFNGSGGSTNFLIDVTGFYL